MSKMKNGLLITGVKEIDAAFQKYEKEMKKILRKNMRIEVKPLAKEIKSNFPKDTGETRKGIRARAGKGQRRGDIYLRAASQDDNYIPKFIEFGTEPPRDKDEHGRMIDRPKDHVRPTEESGFRIKPHLVYTKAYEKMGDSVREKTLDAVKRDAEQLMKRMEDKSK